jgi:transposase
MEGKRYPSDLTDQEWEILEFLLPPPNSGGRPVQLIFGR